MAREGPLARESLAGSSLTQSGRCPGVARQPYPRRPPGSCVPSAHPVDLRSAQYCRSGLRGALGASAMCDS